jgi:hypothetical protein
MNGMTQPDSGRKFACLMAAELRQALCCGLPLRIQYYRAFYTTSLRAVHSTRHPNVTPFIWLVGRERACLSYEIQRSPLITVLNAVRAVTRIVLEHQGILLHAQGPVHVEVHNIVNASNAPTMRYGSVTHGIHDTQTPHRDSVCEMPS